MTWPYEQIQMMKLQALFINNSLQNTTRKTKDWATQTPLKTGEGKELKVMKEQNRIKIWLPQTEF